ncbi:hypothetical protein BDW66DRAFT_163942 [Aspergillus desertorum]
MQSQHSTHLKRPFALSASPSPSSSTSSSSSAHYCYCEPTAKKNLPNTFRNWFNDKTYAQRFRERLEGYRSCREKELGEPFNPDGSPSYSRGLSPSPDRTICEEDYGDEVLAPDSLPLSVGYPLGDDGHGDDDTTTEERGVHPQPYPQSQPQFIPKHETEHYAPLSNDAISNILLQCTPQSPSAQTWIRAQRADKINKERKRALLRQRDDLRRQVLQLRPSSEWTMNRAARAPVLKDDGDENEAGPGDSGLNAEGLETPVPREAPSCEQCNDLVGFKHRGRGYVLDEKNKQWLKVFRSTGRLQVAACHEGASIVPAPAMQEFQKYFKIFQER